MKRWKITAKRKNSLTVFLTAEALYTWLSDGSRTETLDDPEYKKEIHTFPLKKGDELYAEWLGSEYVYDDKLDQTHILRSIKFTIVKPIKGSWVPIYIENIEAWVADGIVDMSDGSYKSMSRTRARPLTVELVESDHDPVKEAMSRITDPLVAALSKSVPDAKIEL